MILEQTRIWLRPGMLCLETAPQNKLGIAPELISISNIRHMAENNKLGVILFTQWN